MVTNGSTSKSAVLNGTGALELNLHVSDSETYEALSEYEDERERNDFAVSALRIGVIALLQAQGRIDADRVRQEGERFISKLSYDLSTHQKEVTSQINSALKEYFDPESGRLNERIKRLVENDGELERVMREQVGSNGSELNRTLAAYVGTESPLMKKLDPNATDGLINVLTEVTEAALNGQRERILNEFSLDNSEGALSRLVSELKSKHGEVGTALEGIINSAVEEFSLDKDDSALSRLMSRVEQAQQKISSEFSLDEDGSALARMRKELLAVFEEQRKTNEGFQREVLSTLTAMAARKEESKRGTQHGLEFEEIVFDFISGHCQESGDVAIHTGKTTGRVPRSFVGDAVIELSPDSAAAGARIVVEAKQRESYSLSQALSELENARRNREAGVGLFVCSERSAPDNLRPFNRIGDNIVVVWDAENPSTDVVMDAGLSVAKALSVRARAHRDEVGEGIDAIEGAVQGVEKQLEALDQIAKWANTIRNNSVHILGTVDSMRANLTAEIGVLNTKVRALRQ